MAETLPSVWKSPARMVCESSLVHGDMRKRLTICRGLYASKEAPRAVLTTSSDRPSSALSPRTTVYRYTVVRGLNADEGRSLLVVSTALGASFDAYRPRQIVKRFRMSPWTNELSHTIRAGDFHTDGNVSAIPPVGTAMQCEIEDPGAPEFAEQRVAYLPHLLERLASGDREDAEALAFLTEAETAMAHERSNEVWRGRLVQNDTIRYHPQ